MSESGNDGGYRQETDDESHRDFSQPEHGGIVADIDNGGSLAAQ
jgi:hypothetical protein